MTSHSVVLIARVLLVLTSNCFATAAAGAWIETDSNAPIQARHEACFVMVGDVAILVGGRGNRDTDIYNPKARTWSKGARPPLQLHHMQCVAAQGKLWILAAWTGNYPRETTPNVIYVYDPITDDWSTKTAVRANRRRGAAAVVVHPNDNLIYVSHGNIGGHETGDHAKSKIIFDVYNIAKNKWTRLPAAKYHRDHTGGAWVGGRVCVAGGRDGGMKGWPAVAPTECYNFATKKWEEEAPIPQVRAGSAYGTTCDGKLMVAGGEGSGKAWNNVEVFDGKKWTKDDNLNVGRHGTGLAVNCDCNEIYIASGAANQGGGPEIRSVETYFPGGKETKCR